MSELNPYASPQAEQHAPDNSPSRDQAQKYVRRTLLIMLVPVAVNVWAMYFWNAGTAPMPEVLRWSLVAFNVVWFGVLFAVLWFGGLGLIEIVARLLRMVFGGGVSRDAWLNSLHESLWPLVPAAAIGSVLWILWLCLFFLAGHPGGFALDVVFQIAGNVLGAWVYLSVFWNWYQLRRQSILQETSHAA